MGDECLARIPGVSVVAEARLEITDPDGREVVFDAKTRAHIARRRPELLDHIDAILDAVARPDFRRDDAIPSRQHFYRRHLDARRWLRVIVDFDGEPAYIVTAFIRSNSPGGWNQ